VPLSLNLGTLTSWNPLDHSRPITGLLYLYIYIYNIYSINYVPLSWKLGTLTSCNPLDHSRPITGLLYLYICICIYIYIYIHTECPRRNLQYFGRVFLMLNYTDITENTYIQSWTVTEIMAREVWNFDSCYTLNDYQIHIETGRNMWFM